MTGLAEQWCPGHTSAVLRQRRLDAPGWLVALVQGLLFTVLFAAGTALAEHGSFAARLPAPLVAGAVFGAVLGRRTTAWRRDLFSGLGTTSPQDRAAGVRAARRGPTPSDPVVRAVAAHVAEQRLARALLDHRRQVLVLGALTVAYLVAGSTWSRGWFLAAAVFLAPFVLAVREPRRRLRRLAVLTQPSGPGTPDPARASKRSPPGVSGSLDGGA